jgi:predicted metalloprotease with PDZ domain
LKNLFTFAVFFWAVAMFESSYGKENNYEYTLTWRNAGEHIFDITLVTLAQPGKYTDFLIPAWRPGRYILQNYAASVFEFRAQDEKGKALPWEKINKDTWRVWNEAQGETIKIEYRFYAGMPIDAGTSYLNETMVYFNGVNLFMHKAGELDLPCSLTLPNLPLHWKAATALAKTSQFNRFTAKSYHELVDSPSIFSPNLTQFSFTLDGLKAFIHFYGKYEAPPGAEKTLIANVTKIIKEQKAIFGEFIAPEHHFIYLLSPNRIRHAVEHTASSMYVLPESVAASEKGFEGLYSITSHEFWHTWNVKSIRPAALWPYDYSKEVYTKMHWFTEGVTDYYTYLTLVRAGLMKPEDFLNYFSSVITSLENNPAQEVVSPAMASFDSWLSTSSFGSPHHKISFYTLGSRLGLLLDLELRRVSNHKTSLDDLFVYLYKEYYKKGKGYPEDAALKAAEALTKKSFKDFFAKYVEGVAPIDYNAIFEPLQLRLEVSEDSEASASEKIGILKVAVDMASGGIKAELIRPASDAAKAGLQEGDHIVSWNGELFDDNALGKTLKPGKQTLGIRRAGKELTLEVDYTGKSCPKKYKIVFAQPGQPPVWFTQWIASKAN